MHLAGLGLRVFLVMFMVAVVLLSAKMDVDQDYARFMLIPVTAGLVGALGAVLVHAIRRRWLSHGHADRGQRQRDHDDEPHDDEQHAA